LSIVQENVNFLVVKYQSLIGYSQQFIL